jgi:hypothetical protein
MNSLKSPTRSSVRPRSAPVSRSGDSERPLRTDRERRSPINKGGEHCRTSYLPPLPPQLHWPAALRYVARPTHGSWSCGQRHFPQLEIETQSTNNSALSAGTRLGCNERSLMATSEHLLTSPQASSPPPPISQEHFSRLLLDAMSALRSGNFDVRLPSDLDGRRRPHRRCVQRPGGAESTARDGDLACLPDGRQGRQAQGTYQRHARPRRALR